MKQFFALILVVFCTISLFGCSATKPVVIQGDPDITAAFVAEPWEELETFQASFGGVESAGLVNLTTDCPLSKGDTVTVFGKIGDFTFTETTTNLGGMSEGKYWVNVDGPDMSIAYTKAMGIKLEDSTVPFDIGELAMRVTWTIGILQKVFPAQFTGIAEMGYVDISTTCQPFVNDTFIVTATVERISISDTTAVFGALGVNKYWIMANGVDMCQRYYDAAGIKYDEQTSLANLERFGQQAKWSVKKKR